MEINMTKFIIKRIGISVIVFFGITLLVFVLVSLTPGSPAEIMLGGDLSLITPEAVAEAEKKLCLDQPVIVQYIKWLGQIFQGNLGIYYRTTKPVLNEILPRLKPTLILTVTSTLLSMLIAIPLGALSACKPYSVWDYLASGMSFVGTSVPNFFVSLILIYVFAVKLHLLPVSGMYDSAANQSLASLLVHMICPVIALSLQSVGGILRQTRGTMLEALHGDYIRTSRALGLSELRVIFCHGLRNALLPVLSVISGRLPFIIGGAVITEQIFSWPGLGSLMVISITYRDYSCIMGITVFIAAVVLIGNILTDIAYGFADPRIRHSRG